MIHEVLPVGPLACNCSIIGSEATREAIVIDPGADIDQILAIVAKHKLRVTAIAVTHAHLDHIGGAADLRAATGAPVYMNKDDLVLIPLLGVHASWLQMPDPGHVEIDQFLKDGDTYTFAGTRFDVLHTPGHTPGSVSLLLPAENRLIAGDTLFRGSVGRTDLQGGDQHKLFSSIKTKLLDLEDAVDVVCGHGPGTTIGVEREFNPFLRGL